MKVAIVYDRVNKWGGAERVLLALHEMFPEAPLYTSVYSPCGATWAKVFPDVVTSFLQRVPFAKKHHELLPVFMPTAFEWFDFSVYDLVISVTSEAAKGIITMPSTKHICYLLTPTRYLWSHNEHYFKNKLFSIITRPLVGYLKSWDYMAAQRPDLIISISKAVQARTEKYYGRKSEIIYPPVEIVRKDGKTTPHAKDYFLVLGRLVAYKKVDLVVKTFNKLGLPLVIVGTGREEKKLKQLAKSNVLFTGFVKEEDLGKYYRGAKALIFPQEEDFGLTSVEAQSYGVPVIAYKKGGSLDTVCDLQTGIFFEEQTIESLMKAIEKFNDMKFDVKMITKNAEKFSKERFKKEFLKIVQKV